MFVCTCLPLPNPSECSYKGEREMCCKYFSGISSQGAGCSLMERRTRFEGIVRGMTAVAGCPVTVKMRTGVHHRHWNAHKLLPRLRDWGVAMATVSTYSNCE